MCERCNRVSPLDSFEKMDNYVHDCFLYGQDMKERNVSEEAAMENAMEFTDKLLVPRIEMMIGVGFCQCGYENPKATLNPINKTMFLLGIMESIQEAMGSDHMSDEDDSDTSH